MTLLEKEWIKFGYKFSHRSGHLNNVEDTQKSWSDASSKMFGVATKFLGSTFSSSASNNNIASSETWTPNHEKPKEFSPIFAQFLDCVYQLWTQFPTAFEFDERLLGLLNRSVYSCEFGTFLTNCEKERLDFRLLGRTLQDASPSLWSYINSNRISYVNEIYIASSDVLTCRTENLKYWKYLYFEACGITEIFNDEDDVKEEQIPDEILQDNSHNHLATIKASSVADLSMESMTEVARKLTTDEVHRDPSVKGRSVVDGPPLDNPWA